MPSNKRGSDGSGAEHEQVKRTRNTQGSDIRAITPMALNMALGNHPTYTPNMHPTLALPTPIVEQAPLSTSPENLTLDLPSMPTATTYTPFASTYHHSGAPHPYATRYSNMCGMRIGNTPFEHVNINIPDDMSKEDAAALKAKWDSELERQKQTVPALPPSNVPELPVKVHAGVPVPFPHNGTVQEQRRATEYNDWLSAQTQRIDRERNNKAAKKSRETRLESLDRTRTMLNDAAAERDWLRLKLLQRGGDPGEWDAMDVNLKRRLVEVVEQRVKEKDQHQVELKKRDEAKKRAERTRAKQETINNRLGGILEAPNEIPEVTGENTSALFAPVSGMGDDDADFLNLWGTS